MKLLLENWRAYTNSLVNEELLIESYEQAQESVSKRATKLIKGWSYAHNKQAYDAIEKQAAIDSEKYWADDAVYSWEIGGKLISSVIKQLLIPDDIEEKQKKLALLWAYNQIANGTDLDILLRKTFDFISNLYNKGTTSVSNEEFNLYTDPETFEIQMGETLEDYLYKIEPLNIQWFTTPDNNEYQSKKSLIERFFQMNRFVKDGKRDLNAVSNFDELYQLIEEARPKYQEWNEKQENKDAEKGKEYLFENERWKIIVIHSPSAAREFAKQCDADWCTGSPGVGEKYFKKYYKPNDPLFGIHDKSDNSYYQFNFGSKQYMDVEDQPIEYNKKELFVEILLALDKVVPPKYDIARKGLDKLIKDMKLKK